MEHTEQCPYCNTTCGADWVDVGVGLVQCGPFNCAACGASECGPYDSDEDQARRDPKTGWYRPGDPPGSSANVIGGQIATATEAKAAYHSRFAGSPDYDCPGEVEAWWASQRTVYASPSKKDPSDV